MKLHPPTRHAFAGAAKIIDIEMTPATLGSIEDLNAALLADVLLHINTANFHRLAIDTRSKIDLFATKQQLDSQLAGQMSAADPKGDERLFDRKCIREKRAGKLIARGFAGLPIVFVCFSNPPIQKSPCMAADSRPRAAGLSPLVG